MSPATIVPDNTKEHNTGPKVPDKAYQSIDNLAEKPLERLWRGDEADKLRFEGRPDFKGDKYAERQWIKEHMAAAFRFWGKKGFGEGIAGHITVKDPVKAGHYWMGPIGKHFSSIKVSDLVLVAPDGTVSSEGAQLPIHAAGFHIHSAIHEARPDVTAAAHCHSPYARAWSVYGRPIDIATQDACIFWDNLAVYRNFGGIVLAAEEGKNIAEALGPKSKAILLQNHGSLTIGETIDEAMHYFYALETACHGQLLIEAAAKAGLQKTLIGEEDAKFSAKTLQNPDVLYIEFRPEYELLVEETGGAFLQ